MNRPFWKNKKVLLTGHTGFKGSWLSLWLQNLGASVVGYALPPPTQPSLFEIAGVARGMRSIEADVRDPERLRAVVAEHRPEIVLHLAAQSLVHRSYRDPVETYSTNVMGAVNLLEAIRNSPSARVVLIVTSDKCYENRELLWGYREVEPMGGHDPYSSSKGCVELVTAAYRRSFFAPQDYPEHGVALASARAGNVVGGGDWAENRLIPDIMRSFLAGRPASIRNPDGIRPWQHVLEPLSGYLRLAERLWADGPEFAAGWNFGPYDEDAQPVARIVDRLASLWGEGARWVAVENHRAHEANYLKLDSSRARTLLGWSPKLRLWTTLEWIVAWYRAYQQKQDIHRFTCREIERHENLE